jgi:glycosyltransferase involved in cell wall biosynthesis
MECALNREDAIEHAPRFSVIVPAFNEEACLPQLLDTVDVARAAYRDGPDAIEVIVADNGSTDATAEIARARGCRVVSVAKRVIAAVRNGGAAAARGTLLAFTDADMRIHPETFNAIDDAMSQGRAVAGTTGVTLDRWSLGLAVTYAAFLPLVWLTRLDTGVVFCRQEDFVRVDGYNEVRRYAEDVQFLCDLRRLGRRRGQRLVRLRSVKAVASTRKFDKYGDWHYFTSFHRLFVKLLVSPGATTEFADRYWYGDR